MGSFKTCNRRKADGTCIPAPEPALDAKVPEDSDMRGQFGPRTKDTVDKANQLLDDFSNMLKKETSKSIDQTQ
jgi:glycine amidinotransferase